MEANSRVSAREALKGLFDLGIVPKPEGVAACMPCITGGGYSPDSEWCAKCGNTKKKCIAIYNARKAVESPERNCDRHDSGAEAYSDWRKNFATCDDNKAENEEFNEWLFAPTKGSEATK